MGKSAVLVVSFGTSHLETLEKNITAIEADVAAALPGRDLFRAFTSGMILKKLRERDGLCIPDTVQALEDLLVRGYDDVVIQPTHLMNGDEYDKLMGQARPFLGRFARLTFGAPLLCDIDDYPAVVNAIAPRLPPRTEGVATVLMGHGTGHFANAAYALLEYVFHDLGRPDVRIGTVEGYPTLDEVLRRLAERPGTAEVHLFPLMIVAGDHAQNDMAGDGADSWRVRLEAAGYRVTCHLTGLGENPDICALFAHHARRAEGEME